MDLRFDGAIVAITGIGSGFGRAIAEAFLARGAAVFGCDLSDEGLDQASKLGKVVITKVDLADREAAADWVRSVEHGAGAAINVLVNNAGGPLGIPYRTIEKFSDEDWDRIFAANIHATFAVTRAALPAMKKAGRGRIINITSGAGLRPSLSGLHAYASAKHAMVGFTRQLAVDTGVHGITVNSVAPGAQMTSPAKLARWESYSPEKQQAFLSRIAMRRLGEPRDIANAVLFFASGLSSFVTGEILSVNGGSY